MPRLKAFSIRDTKGECYSPPFYKVTAGEAERDFRSMAADEKTMISTYPEDFDLFYVGEFDDETGKFVPLDTPSHIMKALDAQKLNNPKGLSSVGAIAPS